MNPQQHVETVLKRCFELCPKKRKMFFNNLVKQGSMPEKMASMITTIIEDPNCVYIVRADGTLKILE